MIVRGLWRLAKCDRAGISEFGKDLDHFYASLAPLIGIPLAGALITAISGAWQQALLGFVSRLVAVLLMPVVVYEFARMFNREDHWLRTASVLNWSVWLLFPLAIVAAFFGALLKTCGLSMVQAEMGALAAIGLYMLWYQLFVLVAGLGIGYWRAASIVLVSALALAIVTSLPLVLGLIPMPVPGAG